MICRYIVRALVPLACFGMASGGSLHLPVAQAQQAEGADELFRKGKAAAEAKNWLKAHRLLSQAWQLKQSYDIASNLGQVAYLIGKPVEAARHVAFALRHYPATGDAEQKQNIRSLFELVQQKVATLVVRVSSADAEVLVDGVSIGRASTLPPELFVEPGQHAISARLQGETVQRELDAQAGARYQVALVVAQGAEAGSSTPPATSTAAAPAAVGTANEVRMHQARPAAAPEDAAAGSRGSSLPPKLVAVLVGGGLTLASGVALTVYTVKRARAETDLETYRARAAAGSPNTPNPCASGSSHGDCRRLAEAKDDWQSTGKARNVLMGTTLGLGLATLATYLLWPEQPEPSQAQAGASSASGLAAARLSPLITPHEQGFMLTGDF
jgi:hypothetical protein